MSLDTNSSCQVLTKTMGGLTILEKGVKDVISNGDFTLICEESGSPRRCGGQGDILSGLVAGWMAWFKGWEQRIWSSTSPQEEISNVTVYASFAASYLTRNCSGMAFSLNARGMMTTDVLQQIPMVFWQIFETDTVAKQSGQWKSKV